MPEVNGQQDSTIEAIGDIKEIAKGLNDKSISVIERVRGAGASFEQATHTLMLESVDKITQQWVDELDRVRENTRVVEQMVIQQAAKVKDELTRLHLLGVQAMREAERGSDLSRRLVEELESLMADQTTH